MYYYATDDDGYRHPFYSDLDLAPQTNQNIRDLRPMRNSFLNIFAALTRAPTSFFLFATFWFWWAHLVTSVADSDFLPMFCCPADHYGVAGCCFLAGLLCFLLGWARLYVIIE